LCVLQAQIQKEFEQCEGWLRHMVAERVRTQFSPRLDFILESDTNQKLEQLFEKLDREEAKGKKTRAKTQNKSPVSSSS